MRSKVGDSVKVWDEGDIVYVVWAVYRLAVSGTMLTLRDGYGRVIEKREIDVQLLETNIAPANTTGHTSLNCGRISYATL